MDMLTTHCCPECQRLQKEVADLRRQNEELQRRLSDLEQAQRRDKRQAAPFGRDQHKADPQKPGRKKGQGTFTFRRAPEKIDQTLDVPLHVCPHCFGPVSDLRQHEHVQTDLPLPQPVTTRFLTYSGYCPHCKRRVQSQHHEQGSRAAGAAAVSLGPHARALAADLHHGLGVPYAKIARLFQSAFGLSVTPSALCQSQARLADLLQPIYREMQQALSACRAVHVDETGWRIGALSAWLWTFAGERITVYTAEKGRSHEAVLRVLGREFCGTLVSDCFCAYDHQALSQWLKQKCLAHLLKDLSALEKDKTGVAAHFSREVAAVLREALALKKEKPDLAQSEYRDRVQSVRSRLDALIAERRRFSDADNARLAKRLRKQRSHLLTFLLHEGVDATNNRAERALRPAVIMRKTGGCNKTDRGARVHATLTSVLVTARQQALNPVEYLAKVICGAPKLPSLTDAAPVL